MLGTKHRNDRKTVETHTHTNTYTQKHIHTHTHTPKLVCRNEDVTLVLNQKVPTNTETMAKRPDTLIKNDEEKTCLLIVVAIPANRNVTQKDAEKNSKIR